MAINKLIATTVSSREKGLRRREEGWTTSSQMQTATQGDQQSNRSTSEGGGRDKVKKVDGDFPACMRLKKDSSDLQKGGRFTADSDNAVVNRWWSPCRGLCCAATQFFLFWKQTQGRVELETQQRHEITTTFHT